MSTAISSTAKSRKSSPPRLRWRNDADQDRPLDFWAATKRPYDTLFCVCIDPPAESDSGKWEVVLSAWVGKGDDPLVEKTIRLPSRLSREAILRQVRNWKGQLVWDTYCVLEKQAGYVCGLSLRFQRSAEKT